MKKIIASVLLLCSLSMKSLSHPVVDSFINTNACFFVKHGLPSEKIKSFKLIYKDFTPDSASLMKRYKNSYWVKNCKIFESKKSDLNEDIDDFYSLDSFKCGQKKWPRNLFSKKAVAVYRLPPLKEEEYVYYYYVFHCGISYMHVIFKMKNDKIIRFCYDLAIS